MADFDTFVQQILGFKRTGELPIQSSSEAPTLLPRPNDSTLEGISHSNNTFGAVKMITTMPTEIERSTPVQIRDKLQSLQDSEERLQLKLSKIAEHALKVVMTKYYSTLQCPPYSCRNPVIPVESSGIQQNGTGFQWIPQDCRLKLK